jgi:phospholipase C
MRRPVFPIAAILMLATIGLLLSLNGCGGGGHTSGTVPPTLGTIQHVVIIFQENRTPDNLFQDPVLIARGANIAQSGVNSQGQTIPLSPIALANDYDLDHSHSAFTVMYDGGKMDGADKIAITCNVAATPPCPPPNPQFMYVQPSDVQPYFALAEQYTFGDNMFQTNEGPSFPAHQFIIAGTSAPSAASNLFVAENAQGVPHATTNTGCTAPPAEFVLLIDPSGNEDQTMFPCLNEPTLIDEMDAQNVSWRYYTPSANFLWTAPNAVNHICQPQTENGTSVCTGPDWSGASPKVFLSQTQVLTDIANNQLPQVSWVIPDGRQSDHASSNDGSGPSWVSSVVNAIGGSGYWGNTAIFITWDDWGGWYDHVAPTVINSYEYGFRVPLIVVSPYAKAGYISHVQHNFGSILKFIEEDFSLPSLGYADSLSDDLSDCFDFNQTPTAFHQIRAPLNGEFFLNDKRPPTDPDDD